jgi:glycosyltransferase involved in cell wall biosynthesis
MNILITNLELTEPGGTISYVADLAGFLTGKGHHVEVYTYLDGTVGEHLKNTGINVVTRLDDLKNVPDIVHAHHFAPAADVCFRFRNTPVIFFVHNSLSPFDIAPVNKQVLRYIAVDHNCHKRLLREKRIRGNTEVVFNWVDTERFRVKENFRDKPQKALLFSNYANTENFYTVIDKACSEENIQLDVLGQRFNKCVLNPEDVLVDYDLVFGKGRSAIESLATGAGVILCDFTGLGVMVNQAEFFHLRDYNFGFEVLTRPFDVELIRQEIKKFDKEENKANAAVIREISSMKVLAEKLLDIYNETIEAYANGKRGHHGNPLWLRISAYANKIYFLNSRKFLIRIIYRIYLVFRKLFGIKN